jgi:hypothetical protein
MVDGHRKYCRGCVDRRFVDAVLPPISSALAGCPWTLFHRRRRLRIMIVLRSRRFAQSSLQQHPVRSHAAQVRWHFPIGPPERRARLGRRTRPPQRALPLFLAGATELCDRVVETSSGESAYLVRREANIERWLTEEDLRP